MRNKIFIFSVGLVAGLTIGVLFSVAIKELITQFKELHLSLNKINLRQSELSQRIDSIQGKLIPDAKKPATPTQNNSKNPAPVATKTSVNQPGTKTQNTFPSNTASTSMPQDTDVVVMTNQLVAVLAVPLLNKDTARPNKKNQQTDSTIAAMSDVGNSKESPNYRVEFWKSPLNYKGYKMSRGKIILYGINPVTPVNLTHDEDTYYLVVNQSAYKVEYTDDYKPFEKVADKIVLKKLGL